MCCYMTEFLAKYGRGNKPDSLWFALFDKDEVKDTGSWHYVNYNNIEVLSYSKGKPELLLVLDEATLLEMKLKFDLKCTLKISECTMLVRVFIKGTAFFPDLLLNQIQQFVDDRSGLSIGAWLSKKYPTPVPA